MLRNQVLNDIECHFVTEGTANFSELEVILNLLTNKPYFHVLVNTIEINEELALLIANVNSKTSVYSSTFLHFGKLYYFYSNFSRRYVNRESKESLNKEQKIPKYKSVSFKIPGQENDTNLIPNHPYKLKR